MSIATSETVQQTLVQILLQLVLRYCLVPVPEKSSIALDPRPGLRLWCISNAPYVLDYAAEAERTHGQDTITA